MKNEKKVNYYKRILEWFLSAIISYFVSLFLAHMPFFNDVEISSSIITIHRPSFGWDILIILLISSAILIIIFYFLTSRVICKFILFSKYLFIFELMVILSFNLFVISSYIPPAEVHEITEIYGKVYDKHLRYYLFVRPINSGNCWVQEPIPLQITHAGKWCTMAYFGGSSGQRFEIIAIGSKEELHVRLFPEAGPYNCSDIPNDTERFVRLVELK